MFRLAVKNVILNWRLSFAALMAVMTAFVCLGLFQGYIRGVDLMYVTAFENRFMFGDVIVDYPTEYGERPGISPDLQKEIDEFNRDFGIKKGVRFLLVSGQIANEASSAVFSGWGYDVDSAADMRGDDWRWNTLAGVPLQNDSREEKFVMGRSLAEFLNCNPTTEQKFLNGMGGYSAEDRPFSCRDQNFQINVVTSAGQMRSLEAPVVGLVDAAYKDLDRQYLTMPIAMAQLLEGTKDVTFYSIRLNSKDQIQDYVGKFDARFKDRGLTARRWQDHFEGDFYIATISLLNTFRNFVVFIISLAAGLSVFNSFLKIVKERTREIGTLRAFGFSGRRLRRMIALESLVLVAVGVIGGVVFSVLFCLVANRLGILYKAGVLTEPVPFMVKPTAGHFLASGILIGVVSLIASWVPIRGLLKKPIYENLTEPQ